MNKAQKTCEALASIELVKALKRGLVLEQQNHDLNSENIELRSIVDNAIKKNGTDKDEHSFLLGVLRNLDILDFSLTGIDSISSICGIDALSSFLNDTLLTVRNRLKTLKADV